jgi:hypothetical protein
VNYSRQKQDTLISTFSATCKTDEYIIFGLPQTPAPPSPGPTPLSPQYEVTANLVPSSAEPGGIPEISATWAPASERPHDAAQRGAGYDMKFTFSGALPHNTNTQTITNEQGAVIIFYAGRAHVGNVTWYGYYLRNKNEPKETYSLRRTITDAQSGTTVGYVYLGLYRTESDTKLQIDNFKVSRNAIDLLIQQGSPHPTDYWGSLPSCVTSGPFAPNALNFLQQLGPGVSAPTMQQP